MELVRQACSILVGLFVEQGEEKGELSLTFWYQGDEYIYSFSNKEGTNR